MRHKLLLLSFIEGAAVMAAELCGARLLAPVFGSSLYVWASVMGITLAALALGYFFGAYYSSRGGNTEKKLFWVLSLAALFVMLMPLMGHYLVPHISYLPFISGVVCSAITLLFFPVFFLGASSPLFILVQSNEQNNAGKVSGVVYAVSTAGGIAATFLYGFYCIPQWGLLNSLLVAGALLFAANILVFKIFKGLPLFVFAGLVYLTLRVHGGGKDVLYASDGLLGRVEVRQMILRQGDTLRYLTLNGTIQSQQVLHSKVQNRDYFSLFDTLINKSQGHKQALVLGLGAGICANALIKKNYGVDAVELDPRISRAAQQFFYLDKRVRCFNQDARYFINTCQKKYDCVLFDVFKAEEQPSHVITSESLERLNACLSDSAVLYINWHGFLNGPEARGTEVLYSTLKQAGFRVQLCAYDMDEPRRNLIFVASRQDLHGLPYCLNRLPAPGALASVDNRPLFEEYNAGANKTWRENYLRYYQGAGNR